MPCICICVYIPTNVIDLYTSMCMYMMLKNAHKRENIFDVSCPFDTLPVENSAFDDVTENALLW